MSNLAARLEGLRLKNKHNLAMAAYEQIKEAIIYAKFKPGESLSENALASVLGMSRTPVREALKELAREDLVEILPGRGAFVKDISIKELKDIYEMRAALECLAAKTAIANINDEEIAMMKKAWQSILEGNNQEEVAWEQISNLDNMFHRMIIDKSDNAPLREVMGLVNQKILRYQLLSAQALGDVRDTVRQHLSIIELMEVRNTEKLVPALATHIEEAARNVILKEIGDHLL